MTKKTAIINKIITRWEDNSVISTEKIIFPKKQDGILVKDMNTPDEHYHIYADKDGNIQCHHKNERTGLRTRSHKYPR